MSTTETYASGPVTIPPPISEEHALRDAIAILHAFATNPRADHSVRVKAAVALLNRLTIRRAPPRTDDPDPTPHEPEPQPTEPDIPAPTPTTAPRCTIQPHADRPGRSTSPRNPQKPSPPTHNRAPGFT